MDSLLIVLAFMGGLIAGPFIVVRVWPDRTSFEGNASVGECGSSPVFWGSALGCLFGYLVISAFILTGPETTGNLSAKMQAIAFLFAMLAVLAAPLVICGFHRWKWSSEGVEFVGLFRRQSLRWKDVTSVRRTKRMGWTLHTTSGSKLSTSNYVPGERCIIGALAINRPDLAPQVISALENERA